MEGDRYWGSEPKPFSNELKRSPGFFTELPVEGGESCPRSDFREIFSEIWEGRRKSKISVRFGLDPSKLEVSIARNRLYDATLTSFVETFSRFGHPPPSRVVVEAVTAVRSCSRRSVGSLGGGCGHGVPLHSCPPWAARAARTSFRHSERLPARAHASPHELREQLSGPK